MREEVLTIIRVALTLVGGLFLGYQLGELHGAISVYEKSIVCEQALDEWVCKKVDER